MRLASPSYFGQVNSRLDGSTASLGLPTHQMGEYFRDKSGRRHDLLELDDQCGARATIVSSIESVSETGHANNSSSLP
jgi:hypothetical protein